MSCKQLFTICPLDTGTIILLHRWGHSNYSDIHFVHTHMCVMYYMYNTWSGCNKFIASNSPLSNDRCGCEVSICNNRFFGNLCGRGY